MDGQLYHWKRGVFDLLAMAQGALLALITTLLLLTRGYPEWAVVTAAAALAFLFLSYSLAATFARGIRDFFSIRASTKSTEVSPKPASSLETAPFSGPHSTIRVAFASFAFFFILPACPPATSAASVFERFSSVSAFFWVPATVGVTLLGFSIYKEWGRRKLGRVRFRLDSSFNQHGKRFVGLLVSDKAIIPNGVATASLECWGKQSAYRRRQGGGESVGEWKLAQTQQPVPSDAWRMTEGITQVTIDLPFPDAKEFKDRNSGGGIVRYEWRLIITAPTPGIDFHADFRFAIPGSPQGTQAHDPAQSDWLAPKAATPNSLPARQPFSPGDREKLLAFGFQFQAEPRALGNEALQAPKGRGRSVGVAFIGTGLFCNIFWVMEILGIGRQTGDSSIVWIATLIGLILVWVGLKSWFAGGERAWVSLHGVNIERRGREQFLAHAEIVRWQHRAVASAGDKHYFAIDALTQGAKSPQRVFGLIEGKELLQATQDWLQRPPSPTFVPPPVSPPAE
jgi:hypothetical protein